MLDGGHDALTVVQIAVDVDDLLLGTFTGGAGGLRGGHRRGLERAGRGAVFSRRDLISNLYVKMFQMEVCSNLTVRGTA